MGATARSLIQRPHNGAPCKADLELIVRIAFGVAQQQVGGALERGLVGALSAQRALGSRIAPRFVRDAAKREARLPDLVAFEFERRRDRYQGERIGEAVADFQVRIVGIENPRRKLDTGDDLLWLQVGVALRGVAGQAVKIRKRDYARSRGPATWTLASSAASATHMSDG